MSESVQKAHRGFAAMDPEKRQAIARLGGQTAQKKGGAHKFTPEEARLAGQKGGKSVSRRGVEYMRALGHKGGASPHRTHSPRTDTPASSEVSYD